MDRAFALSSLPSAMRTPTRGDIAPNEGGEDDELIVYKTLPEKPVAVKPYCTQDFTRWCKDFRMSLPAHLMPILDGTEECHDFPMRDEDGDLLGNFIGNRLVNFNNSIERFSFVYRALYNCITVSKDARQKEALSIINQYEEYQAYEVWKELDKLHHDKTTTNKLQSVQALFKLRQHLWISRLVTTIPSPALTLLR